MRAQSACYYCRARKVRCDAIEYGIRCTNCRLDDVKCVVRNPRRIMYKRRHELSEPPHISTFNGAKLFPDMPAYEEPQSKRNASPPCRTYSPYEEPKPKRNLSTVYHTYPDRDLQRHSTPDIWDFGLDYSLTYMLYQIQEPPSSPETSNSPSEPQTPRDVLMPSSSQLDADALELLSSIRLAPGELDLLAQPITPPQPDGSIEPKQEEEPAAAANVKSYKDEDEEEDEKLRRDFDALINYNLGILLPADEI